MTTYNGERFLIEQLESLKNQTRNPDEVIICDDISQDNTVKIAHQFIEENGLQSSWTLKVNRVNKGVRTNFLDCASMAKGDVIFFCDQDDVWKNTKIDKMMAEFENNSSVLTMGCSFTCIDSEGKRNNTLFNRMRIGNGDVKRIKYSTQVREGVSVGLTLAARREFFHYLAPIIKKYNLPYDTPIGMFSAVTSGYYRMYQPLVSRRVYHGNVSAPKYTLKSRLTNVDSHITGRQMHVDLMKACFECAEGRLNNFDKQNLLATITSTEKSIAYMRQRRKIPLFFAIFSRNPMHNKLIAVVNFLCTVFGKNYKPWNSKEGLQ